MRFSMKLIAAALTLLMTLALFAGCGKIKDPDPSRGNVIKVAAMNGPTMIGLAKLDADAKAGTTANDYINAKDNNSKGFAKESTPAAITAGLANKTFDAAALPCNNAAILFNNPDMDIQVAAINTLNVLYLVTRGVTVTSLSDLSGKTVYSPGLGATPEYVFKYLLEKNNVKNVDIQYKTEGSEIVAGLKNGTMEIAVLPQPAATSACMGNNPDNIKAQINLADEWKKIPGNADKEIITGVLVVRRAYLVNNKETFDMFLNEYKFSADYMADGANLDAAAQLTVDLGIIGALGPAEAALPKCGVTFIEGADMKDKVSAFLGILHGMDRGAVGGKLPGDKFYYSR